MQCTNNKSKFLIDKAKKSIAGGANSSMRVVPYHLPLFIERAEGIIIRDADGNQLIDMNMGYGPLLFGHKPGHLVDAIKQELEIRGTVLGFPNELSHRVAEIVKEAYPSVDLMRFASSGTEVGQTAVRLARQYTDKSHIVLFEGHYHGSSDSVFHRYHAPVEELENNTYDQVIKGTGGMNQAPGNAFLLPWNDLESLKHLLDREKDRIAGIIMEPVMGNAGVIAPDCDYLNEVRYLCDENNIVLIFDEVITGFRIARGGAQERYRVQSDITTFSKAMNGGMPVSAIGGKKEIMDLLTNGDVFHGGVYSGNPISMAATLATQEYIKRNAQSIYQDLENYSYILSSGLKEIFNKNQIPVVIDRVGAMLSIRFLKSHAPAKINDYRSLYKNTDPEKYIKFQHKVQKAGVYFHPNHYEPWYLSTLHDEMVIEKVLNIIEDIVNNGDL